MTRFAPSSQPPATGCFWKTVKLFSYGTKVFSLIPQAFHHNTLKEFWRLLVPDLVS